MDHFRELKIQKELNWDKVRPLLVLFWLMGKKLPGFGIQTKQDSSVFLIICILSKLGKKVRPLTLLKFVFFCRNGVMKDASPAILSSLSVVDGIAVPGFTRYLVLQYQALDGIWYCGTRLYKVFGIAAPGFTRYLVLQYNTRFHKVFCNAVPGCTRYLVLQYQAFQAIWYCGTKALQVC